MAAQAYCPKLRNRLFELAREWMRAARDEVRRVGLRTKTQNDQAAARQDPGISRSRRGHLTVAAEPAVSEMSKVCDGSIYEQ